MTVELDLKLGGGLRAAGEARRALASLEDRLPPVLLEDVRLLVNELVTNSIRHGRLGRRGWIGLRVSLAKGLLRVEVSDPGGGFKYVPRARDGAQESGWGLFLVDRIADRWGIEPGDLSMVWFEIDSTRARDRALWVAEDPGA